MGSTITIDRTYFETLLRRADLHHAGNQPAATLNVPIVTVSKAEYDNLLLLAHEYASLKQALFNAGIDQETLETLIRGNQGYADQGTDGLDNITNRASGGVPLFSPPTNAGVGFAQMLEGSPDHSDLHWTPVHHRSGSAFQSSRRPNVTRQDNSLNDSSPWRFGPEGPSNDQKELRTLVAKNLPDRIKHLDIVNVVRGSALLDVWVRHVDRFANISFVDAEAAKNFLTYTKRNPIYIHGSKVDFAWSDRQYVVSKHVAYKIAGGATRNLVMYDAPPEITEARLRDDLDHIHNLVVVNVSFVHGNVYLSMNSVHNALFARSCMASRLIYKHVRIEWYPDECSQPLPALPKVQKPENNPPSTRKTVSPGNRFQMLVLANEDGTEDGSDDNSIDNTMSTELSTLNVN